MTKLLTSVDEFRRVGGSEFSDLSRYLAPAESRILRLVLQSAWREGLLKTEQLEQSSLSVRGEACGGGDRYFLTKHDKSLSETLEAIRSLSGVSQNGAWSEFCREMEQAQLSQAAAYLMASRRAAPESYLDFEAWTPEGHNLHPGAKTRSGFRASDHLAYAPDLCSEVHLPWLAVSKELLASSGRIDPLFELNSQTWAVPVHPWQLENILPKVYEPEFQSGSIRELDRPPVSCRVCTSLRTLVPTDESLPVLKTSVGSLMTSTERSMSPYTVRQGPIYTEYLHRVFEWQPSYAKKVTPMTESGGVAWADSSTSLRKRNFSLLFRQRPPETEDGLPVPCSALPQPLHTGVGTYVGHFFGDRSQARERFRSYLNLLVPFHLTLYLDYGLALEAHLQNCVVVWSAEGPEKLWVRDWGGLRADSQKLKSLAPDLWNRLDSKSVTLSDAATAEKKLIACLYCNHLTEIVAHLGRECGLSEGELWADIARVSEESFSGHRDSDLYRRVMQEDWPVKCLLKMRLGLGGDGDVYQARPNPLREMSG